MSHVIEINGGVNGKTKTVAAGRGGVYIGTFAHFNIPQSLEFMILPQIDEY